ncbi:MAG: hypothetical protein IKN53_05435 [Oscillibacter sp.]|nr:hypothetical protein [Oscillibacter sp.]
MNFKTIAVVLCLLALASIVAGCAKKAGAETPADEPAVPDEAGPDTPSAMPEGEASPAPEEEPSAPDGASSAPNGDAPVPIAPYGGSGGGIELPDDVFDSAAPPSEEPPAPGGSVDYVDPEAAKVIESTEIASFECSFSLESLLSNGAEGLPQTRHCALFAERTETGAACRYVDDGGERAFTADAAFLGDLQALVSKHDLAQYNGRYHETYGLPDDFGATIRVDYTDGETIRTSDNQDMFLPLEAVRDLVALFANET